jgi:hypothetical protein
MRALLMMLLGWGCAEAPDAFELPVEQAAIPSPMTLTVTDPLRASRDVTFQVTGARPGAVLRLIRSNGGVGAGGCPPALGGQCLDIRAGSSGYVVLLSLTADAQGRARVTRQVPAGLAPGSVASFQVVDADADLGSNPVSRVVQVACADDAFEDDDDPFTANPIAAGQSVSAWSCRGDADWYTINATAGQVIDLTATFDPALADLDLRLYNTIGALVDTADFAVSSPEVISHTAATSGPYFLEVYTDGVVTPGVGYSLAANVSTPAVCSPDPFEPNDVAGSAVVLPAGAWSNLTACSEADYDWYAVDLAVGQTVQIDLLFDNGEGDIDAWLLTAPYTNDPSVFDQYYVARGVTGTDNERLVWTSGVAARHWLAVKLYADAGGSQVGNSYDLVIQTN